MPAVTKQPASVTVQEGQTATFEAIASGQPAPNVLWQQSTNGGSTWSNINVAKVERLTELGLMRPAGVAAFGRRAPERTGVYSFETAPARLGPEYESEFRRDRKAWSWFRRQAPGYQRTATHWVMGAKKEETRRSRLATLIADSAASRKVKPLRRPGE